MITLTKSKEFGFIRAKQIKQFGFGNWFDDLMNTLFPPEVVYHSVDPTTGESQIVPVEQVPPEYIVTQPEVHYSFTDWFSKLLEGYGQSPSTNIPSGSTTLIILGGISLLAYFTIFRKKR